MAKLTTKTRKKIPTAQFALPGRRYPVHDASHAANAKARVAQHGTKYEQTVVNAAANKVLKKKPKKSNQTRRA